MQRHLILWGLFILLVYMPATAQSLTKQHIERLFTIDKPTYVLTNTKTYVKSAYDEECAEKITFTKGSDMMVLTDCKGKASTYYYTITIEKGDVIFTIKGDLWGEYGRHYVMTTNNQATVTKDFKTGKMSPARNIVVLTLTYAENGRSLIRTYQYDPLK